MNIYLAARYSRHPEMRSVRDDLEGLGHVVTSRWIEGNHRVSESAPDKDSEARRFGEEDVQDLRAADVVISFTEIPRSHNGAGGRHVEFGMAYALGLNIIVVGHRENVFHYLQEVAFYPTWEDVLRELKA